MRMVRLSRSGFGIRFGVGWAMAAALAPAALACPGAYSGAACTGNSGANVCQYYGGSTLWSCELPRDGSTSVAGQGYIVYDDAGLWCTAGTYCAFGVDADGGNFCCEIDADSSSVSDVELIGGTLNDTLAFTYTSGGVTLELTFDAGIAAFLDVIAFGRDGNDTIAGSSSTAAAYHEELLGEGGTNLSVRGYAGNDVVRGGPFADAYLDGDDGQDAVYGQGGDDSRLLGGPGADDLFGDSGDDACNGGTGLDNIDGGTGADLLCGGADFVADVLQGGFGAYDDTLWGFTSVDSEYGGLGTGDSCSMAGTNADCETPLTSSPLCP